MSSTKRKTIENSLQRRVRPRRELSEEIGSLESNSSAPEEDDDEDKTSHGSDTSEDDETDEDESSSESENLHAGESISFGALAKAQASFSKSPRASKKPDVNSKPIIDEVWDDREAEERKSGRGDRRDFNRTSKHAPTEISSKKAVSRRREVIPVTKRDFRDPRFETLSGVVDEGKIKKAYSFLDDYRDDEMKEMKTKMNTTKDTFEKDRLKRVLNSMESRKKAQIRKDKEQEILDKHRKEEKLLVKQGKQPFYLKKADQKKRLLIEQYGQLKGKQLDHVIERRRKKVASKEKKNLPWARRDAEAS